MYTTMLLLIFARLTTLPGAATDEPAWAEDYACAYEECYAEHKPMVAFIGTSEGRGNLPLSSRAKKMLKEHFVCVYIDAKGEDNKLARVLNIAEGVVISTEGGRQVAFRHDGQLSKKELESRLGRCCGQAEAQEQPKRERPHSC
ncbi:MAG: hypothetical protein AB7K24_26360 [Gemmataceae bacterium]